MAIVVPGETLRAHASTHPYRPCRGTAEDNGGKAGEFRGLGWISIGERSGAPQQISTVLFAQEPPHSWKDVDRILADSQASEPMSK